VSVHRNSIIETELLPANSFFACFLPGLVWDIIESGKEGITAHIYITIDLKTFYASIECGELGDLFEVG
jgi:hypothetical protein